MNNKTMANNVLTMLDKLSVEDFLIVSNILMKNIRAKRKLAGQHNKWNLKIGAWYNLSDGSHAKLTKINRTKCIMEVNLIPHTVPLQMIEGEREGK